MQVFAIKDQAVEHAFFEHASAIAAICLGTGLVYPQFKAANDALERNAFWQRFHHMHECMQVIRHNLVLADFDLWVIVRNAEQFLLHDFPNRQERECLRRNAAEQGVGVGLQRQHRHPWAGVVVVAGGAVHGKFLTTKWLKRRV